MVSGDNGVCPAHEEFRSTILQAVGGIERVLQVELRALRDELTRRLEESAADRKALHERVGAVAGEVATLAGHVHAREGDANTHGHGRADDDGIRARLAKNWKEVALIILAAISGERVLTALPAFVHEITAALAGR